MSTTIDTQVVQMRFDARDFDNNVQKTMSLLDRFKEQLNFKGAQKGLEDISAASDKVRLTGLENAAIAVEAKFSAMSIVAISAINNIVNTAMNAGTQLVKSLSVDQITAGFGKYEEKVRSVQTIMNATGLSIDEVSAQLDKLAWYADETSYSFTDMVSNVGKFTSNNVPLEKAVTAMQGISNWAAVSGGSVNEASRAMYNLSQSISMGALRLQDWMSIENANMATTEFKQTAIDTAVALGKLTKVGDQYKSVAGKELFDAAKGFRDSLSEEWLTSDVLLETLNKYGEYTTAVYDEVQKSGEMAADVMKRLGDSEMELGAKAFRAAQEAKTFSDAIEATKDAVSTQWMTTFELLFGNYMEAKETWTELANTLWDIFAAGGEVRNEMLASWAELGGRTVMIDAIKAAYEALLSVLSPLKRAFDEMFPMVTAERLYAITEAVLEFFQSLQLSEEAGYTISVMFKTLLLPIKALVNILDIAVYTIGQIISAAFQIADAFLYLLATTNPIEDFFRNVFGDERYTRLMDAIAAIIDRISNAFSRMGQKIGEIITQIRTSEKLRSFFQDIYNLLKPIGGAILDTIVSAFEALVNLDFSNFEAFGKSISDVMGPRLKFVYDLIVKVVDYLGNTATKVIEQLGLSKSFEILKSSVSDLWDAIKDFNLQEVFSSFGPVLETISDLFGKVGQSALELVQRLDPAKILLFAFGTALTGMMFSLTKVFNGFAGIGGSISGFFDALTESIGSFRKPSKITEIATSIAILSGSLLLLSQIDSDKLWMSVGAMGALAGIITVMTGVFAAMDRWLIADEDKMLKLTTSVIKISAALTILVGGLYLLGKVETDGLLGKVIAVTAIIVALGVIVTLMSIFSKPGIEKNAAVLVAFAISLSIMVGSLKKLQNFDGNALLQSIGSLIALMGLLGVLSVAMGKVKFSAATGVTLMIANIFLLVKALEWLGGIPLETITKALPVYISIMSLLTILMLAVHSAGKYAANAGKFAIAISVSILILGQAIKMIGSIDSAVAMQGTVIVSILMLLFTGLTVATGFVNENAASLAKGLIAMSASIILLSLCISYLGKLDLKTAIQGTAVVSALLILFGLVIKLNSTIIHEGESFKSATGAMIAMAVLLGTTASALAILTLIPDQDRLITSAISLSAVILAMGVAAKLIAKTEREVSSGSRIAKSGAGLATVIALLVAAEAALIYLNNMDINDGLVEKATALGIMIAALGAAARLMATEVKVKDMTGVYLAILELTALTGGLVGWLALMEGIDPVGAIAHATALSELLIALGLAMKFFPTIAKFEDMSGAYVALAELTACIGVLGLVLGAMNGIDPVGSIGNATALSILLIALSAAARILSGFESFNIAGAAVALGLLSGCSVVIITILSILDAADLNVGLQNVIALSLILVAMAGAARLMSGIQSVDMGSGIQALLLVAAAIGIMLGIIALIKNFDWSGVENAIVAFGAIGAALGEMIGQFIAHVVSGALSELPTIGGYLMGFFDAIRGIDSRTVESAGNLALAILAITAAEVVNGLASLVPGVGSSLVSFGKDLAELAPYLVTFVDELGGVNQTKLLMASMAVKNFGEAASYLSTGLFDAVGEAIFGKNTLSDFGEELAKFGPYVRQFADSLGDIDQSALNASIEAARALAEFEEALPKHNGVFQSIFGDADLGTFGSNIAAFGAGLVSYSMSITMFGGIDTEAIEESVGAGQALADLEKSLRGQGGVFQTIFGDADLGNFGENIAAFGAGLVAYSMTLTMAGGLNIKAIEDSVAAGQALSDLENTLVGTNGNWQSIFGGNQDLGIFAKNIAAFGIGISDYAKSIDGISFDQLKESAAIGTLFSELEATLGDSNGIFAMFTGGKRDFGDFGSSLESLGKAFKKYFESIEGIDLSRMNAATNSLKQLLDAAGIANETSTTGLDAFAKSLKTLGDDSISGFVDEFYQGKQKIVDAVNDVLSSAMTEIQNNSDFGFVGADIVVTMVTGIIQNEIKVEAEMKRIVGVVKTAVQGQKDVLIAQGVYIITTIIVGMSNKQREFETGLEAKIKRAIDYAKDSGNIQSAAKLVGQNIVSGVIQGVTSKQADLNRTMTNMSNSMIKTTKAALDEHSPSVEFKTIGVNVMAGLENGIDANTKSVNKTMRASMAGLIDEAKEAFLFNGNTSEVMRDQIGVYLIKSIADGITSEMSAEEAAAKKASNIVSAFKTAMDSYAADAEISDLQYSIWRNANDKTATDDEKKSMEQLNYEAKLAAKGKELAAQQAKLTALAMKGFGEDTQEYKTEYQARLKTEKEYGELINEYIDMFGAKADQAEKFDNKVAEFDKYINDAANEAEKADKDYQIWYNEFGRKASTGEIQKREEEVYKAKVEAAGRTFAARRALAELYLNRFGEDSDEYIAANKSLTDSHIAYQEAINTYLDITSPDPTGILMDQINANIKKYSDATNQIELDYQMWENRYGKTASEDELNTKQQELLEAKMEQAGKTVAANEALLDLVMKEYGEDSQEYIDTNASLSQSIISYQKLINEYMEMMNEAEKTTDDTRIAYDTAAAKYRELMSKDMVDALMGMGFSYEEIMEDAKQKSGLAALENPTVKVTYDELYSRYKPELDLEQALEQIDYQEIYDRYIPAIPIDIDFESSAEELDYFELWNKYLPDEVEVQIDAAGEVIKTETKKKTETATKEGAKAGTSAGLASGVTAGVSDFAASVQNGSSGVDYSGMAAAGKVIGNAAGNAVGTSAASAMADAVKTATSSTNKNGLAGVWDNVVNGAAKGLDPMKDVAKQKIGNGVQSGVDWLKTKMGIKSPSTVMITIGEYMIEGLGIGLEGGYAATISAFESVITSFTDVTSYTEQFYEAGYLLSTSMIDGFINGIRNRQFEAINEVVSLAAQMYNAAHQELGVGEGMSIAFENVYGSAGSSPTGNAEQYGLSAIIDMRAAEKQLAQIQATYSSTQASVIGAMMSAAQTGAGLQNGSNGAGNSGVVYNFYQTNNSPTALSRIDIYRDTKNLLSSAKGVT